MAEENFEEQDLGIMQEVDNVPENLHSQEVEEELQETVQEEIQETVQEELQETVEEEIQETVQEELQEIVQETLQETLQEEVQETLQEEIQEDENNSAIVEEKKWPGWPGENVFRMLVPVQRVGGIIGRKGEYIKKVCEETKARIKILDGPPGTAERAVLQIKQDFYSSCGHKQEDPKIQIEAMSIEHVKC